MKSTMIVFAGLLLLTATSCSKNRLRGEGPDISDTRNLNAFSRVEANGSNNVTVVKDSVYKVIVTGHQNLVPAYETRISGSTLRLEYNDKYWNVRNDNVSIEVHTPSVEYASLNGSGNVTVESGFTGSLEGRINGSGEMKIYDGTFNTLRTEINGSGNIKASSSVCDNGYAKISGSGSIEIQAKKYLSAQISGSGNIYYWGSPEKVDLNVSGSGNVSKKN